ncbi:tRNA (guanosine(46)-N7)-methyltransferase TrmB [Ilyomonas limi]|jgi:tRNA (guanine-N7-)-methyltransferase|uniref:tRNA (guanine-N(7)-)-methyltransferase n=1 Tax=Ilyomonas limi TaxID=2575867 RepID=A0A4U3KYD9_9BACT|nr:tRNA (guanosine(46)-N7)-methyltransferase TrmB [Ilyomonas limi]TKK66176.1 tRNA (guanosine(46)-N7)-methyltransferase TrmB [Ilyomonas limi]
MAQKKLQRFADIKEFANVLEYPQDIAGKWHTFFHNHHPIILELACGKGEYTVGLARLHNDINYIGVDIKGNRIWRGAKTALDEGLNNAAFLRTSIEQLGDYFLGGEVNEIWITFPDPQLRASKQKKRLTHPRFLRIYQHILKATGVVHLKTDSPHLYTFTKQVIQLYNLELLVDNDNVYANENIAPELRIQTHYEKMDIAKSNTIHYLQFAISQPLPLEKDEQLKLLEREAIAG